VYCVVCYDKSMEIELIKRKLWKPMLAVVVVIVLTAVAFWGAKLVGENESIRSLVEGYRYLGIFIISLISGFNLIVPIPAVSFLPLFLEVGLSFVMIILVITVGVTIADFITFILGAFGRKIVESTRAKKIITKLTALKERHRGAPLVLLFFFAAFVPFPNEVLLIPLGFIGYRLAHVLPILFAGNIVFNTLAAIGIINLFAII
jgi:membrane protein YqaA with SNARE-associated domain